MNGVAARVSELVNRVGQLVTYKRAASSSYDVATGVNVVTYSDYSVRAVLKEYTTRELLGDVRIGDKKAQIAAYDLPFAPAKDDKIVADGLTYNVQASDRRFISDDAALLILQLRGAGE